MISLRIATQSSHNIFDDILEDDKGHINPELAKLIWRWEKQQHLNLGLPEFQNFSTRDGLRWVKDMVDETRNQRANAKQPFPLNPDDLIQEGVMALMQALKTFEKQSRPNETFETYAKANIQRALEEYSLERAKGTGAGTGSRRQRQPPLSMENTVDIADPLEAEHHYFNQDEWDVREGLVLDNGESIRREEPVEDFLDETLQYEGEDQMWIHEQSVAAPLRDSIPEDSQDIENMLENPSSPDDLALTDMIMYNVDDFLDKNLDETEAQVIQMRFGLDNDEPMTQRDIAYGLGLTVSQVRKLQKRALEKLRSAFTDRYASDDTSHENFWEDTV